MGLDFYFDNLMILIKNYILPPDIDPDRSITRIILERQFSFCLSLRNGIRNFTNEGVVLPDEVIVHDAIIKI